MRDTVQTNSNALAEMPKKSPTSTNAATEWHASAERNKEDLITTQALTRGTEDVDNRNVGRQDPRTTSEASAKGTSAKCTELTVVILESMPHEMQNLPQDSLLLTLRLPIDGEPGECKQEVADSVVTAGRMNQTVEMAEPQITDVDGKAMLGREPAGMVHRVDEGDGMECEPQTNATDNIPTTHGMPLEGEWTWCVSSKVSNPKLDDTSWRAV